MNKVAKADIPARVDVYLRGSPVPSACYQVSELSGLSVPFRMLIMSSSIISAASLSTCLAFVLFFSFFLRAAVIPERLHVVEPRHDARPFLLHFLDRNAQFLRNCLVRDLLITIKV